MNDLQAALENAIARHQAGAAAEAEALYAAILCDHPNQANALHLSGLLAFEQGAVELALTRWEALTRVCPGEAQAWLLVADAHRALGDRAGEIGACRQALALDPAPAAVWMALGVAELAVGRAAESLDAYAEALTRDSLLAAAHAGAATALSALNRAPEAIAAAEVATRLDPQSVQAWFVLGGALRSEGRFEEAILALEKAIALEPRFAAAHLCLAGAHGALNHEAEAEQALHTTLDLDPGCAEATSNLVFLLIGADRVVEAQALSEAALAEDPLNGDARWALTLALLRRGDYARGWPLYARCEWEGPARERFAGKFETPMWRGEDLNGRTLLIYASEGLGDTIQFSRYAKHLAGRGATVILACDAKLTSLLSRTPGVHAAVDRLQALPPHDLWVEQMTLPWLCRTTLDTIPFCAGDLSPDPACVEAWRARLPQGPKFGLVWSGNPAHPNDARRSMETSELAPLLAVPGWTAVSLQVGPRSGEITSLFGLSDHSAALVDFEETAAAVANLDLIIAVDTAVAHLGATLGKPTWAMLSATAEWRWLAGRSDNPWYPTLRTFRQARVGDWSRVTTAVATALVGLDVTQPSGAQLALAPRAA